MDDRPWHERWHATPPDPRYRARPSLLDVGLLCFITGLIALLVTRNMNGIAVLWVANGVLAAAMLVRSDARPQLLASGAAGLFAANLVSGNGVLPSLGMVLANLIDVGVGLWLLQRLRIWRYPFGSLAALARFVPACMVVAPAASALVGAAVARAAFGGSYTVLMAGWFIASSLGAMLVGPLLVMAWRPALAPGLDGPGQGRWQRAAMLAVLVLVDIAALAPLPLLGRSIGFLSLTPGVYAAVLFGHRMAAAAIALAAASGMASLAIGAGPLMAYPTMELRVLALQFFLALMAFACLPIAAVVQERKALADRLALAEARQRLVLEGTGDALLHIDRNGTVLHASRAVAELTGLDPFMLVGRPGIDFIHPDDRLAVAAAHAEVVAAGGSATVRYRYPHRSDGRERWLEARTRAVLTDGQVSGVVSAVRDVTDLVNREAVLAHAARSDPLTGLPNRRAFVERLDAALAGARAGPLAVAMLDIDHFKRINDGHGHAAGDAVLCAIGAAAQAVLRRDDIFARVGGEEFAVLLPDTGLEAAIEIVERVRIAIAASRVEHDGATLQVTASIGAAALGPGMADAPALMAAADACLYAAKSGGRNRVCQAA